MSSRRILGERIKVRGSAPSPNQRGYWRSSGAPVALLRNPTFFSNRKLIIGHPLAILLEALRDVGNQSRNSYWA